MCILLYGVDHMPRIRGLKKRFMDYVFGTKSPEAAYPDMSSSACQKCKILTAYMKLTERAVKLDLDNDNTPISQTNMEMFGDRPRYPGAVTIENRGP